jgi:hypothetical protein
MLVALPFYTIVPLGSRRLHAMANPERINDRSGIMAMALYNPLWTTSVASWRAPSQQGWIVEAA